MPPLDIPPIAEALLAVLVNAIRVMTLRQAARFSNLPHDSQEFLSAVQYLRNKELIEQRLLLAPLPDEPDGPVFSYDPFAGRKERIRLDYDFGPLSAQLIDRSKSKECRKTPCIWASQRGAQVYGGTEPDLSKTEQFGHDLQCAEITIFERKFKATWKGLYELTDPIPPWHDTVGFLKFFENNWRGSDWLDEHKISVNGYVPDVAVVVDDGHIFFAMEQGGQYSPERLKKIHKACVKAKVSYEIW